MALKFFIAKSEENTELVINSKKKKRLFFNVYKVQKYLRA